MRAERFLKSSNPKVKGQLKERLRELENFPDLRSLIDNVILLSM